MRYNVNYNRVISGTTKDRQFGLKNGPTPSGHELEKDMLLCQATQEIESFI